MEMPSEADLPPDEHEPEVPDTTQGDKRTVYTTEEVTAAWNDPGLHTLQVRLGTGVHLTLNSSPANPDATIHVYGSTIIDSVTHATVYVHDQVIVTTVGTHSWVSARDNAHIGTVTDGTVYAWDSAHVGTVAGGEVNAAGNAQVHAVTGGEVHASGETQVYDVSGGVVRVWSDGVRVQVGVSASRAFLHPDQGDNRVYRAADRVLLVTGDDPAAPIPAGAVITGPGLNPLFRPHI